MKKQISLIFLFFPFFCYSQQEMETDRPDQTECTSVIQPGFVQIETGIIYSQDFLKDGITEISNSSFNYATSLIRIGIFKSSEFRIEAGEYLKEKTSIGDTNNTVEGFQPIVIGTKIAVCDENGIIPKIAFLAHLELPFGDKKFVHPNEVIPSFRFSLSHTLSQKFSLGYNLGMEWESGSQQPNYVYTLTTACEVSSKLGVFIETFGGFANNNYPESYFDFGATYAIMDNLQLDTSAGFALNEPSTDLFISLGISLRLPK